MNSFAKPIVQEGDWVRGTSLEDERFRGYVEAVQPADGLVKIRVTACDRAESVGELTVAALRQIEPIPADTLQEQGHLLNWIDLALSIGDEAWFRELSGELSRVRSSAGGACPDRFRVR